MLLRDWMVENNYTQEQLATALGYSRTHFTLLLGQKRPASPLFAESVEEFTQGRITKEMILDGRALMTGGVRRRVRREGIPNKVLPNNAISFL